MQQANAFLHTMDAMFKIKCPGRLPGRFLVGVRNWTAAEIIKSSNTEDPLISVW